MQRPKTAQLSPTLTTQPPKSVMHSASNPRVLVLQYSCINFQNPCLRGSKRAERKCATRVGPAGQELLKLID